MGTVSGLYSTMLDIFERNTVVHIMRPKVMTQRLTDGLTDSRVVFSSDDVMMTPQNRKNE